MNLNTERVACVDQFNEQREIIALGPAAEQGGLVFRQQIAQRPARQRTVGDRRRTVGVGGNFPRFGINTLGFVPVEKLRNAAAAPT